MKERDYTLVVRIQDGHLIVSSPDFKFPVPVVLPFNPPRAETAGKAILAAWYQISDYLNEMTTRGEIHPRPLSHSEVFPKVWDELSLKDACILLGMKPDMVRTLSDEGMIPHRRTPKGHRRFSREKLLEFARQMTKKD